MTTRGVSLLLLLASSSVCLNTHLAETRPTGAYDAWLAVRSWERLGTASNQRPLGACWQRWCCEATRPHGGA